VGGRPAPVTVRRRAVRAGLACLVLLVAVYLLAVWTPAGQRFEDSVLGASRWGAPAGPASGSLAAVSEVTVLAALAVVLSIGLLRRRPLLGALAAGVVVASVLTAEVVQRSLSRPTLLESGYRREDQSFPSGHAAVAMSVMCALVLVTPYRWRGAVVVPASLAAVGVQIATVTASWHRPSDTIGSDVIVMVYTCAVVAVLARLGQVSEADLRTKTGRMTRAALVGGYAALALAALAAAVVTGVTSTALTAGRALALSGGAAVAWLLLVLLRDTDLSGPDGESRL
jgi:membrane-associated phospholipid phosphatase